MGVLLFTEQEWMLYWTWVDFFFLFPPPFRFNIGISENECRGQQKSEDTSIM